MSRSIVCIGAAMRVVDTAPFIAKMPALRDTYAWAQRPDGFLPMTTPDIVSALSKELYVD